MRLEFIVGISYEDNMKEAKEVITVRKTDGIVEDDGHKTFTTVAQLATSTVNLKTYFWFLTKEYGRQAHQIKSDVIFNVKNAIELRGISMPVDIQEIKIYGSQKETHVLVTNKN